MTNQQIFKMNESQKFKSLLFAFRPKTLTAALVPCVAGTALAYKLSFSWIFLVFALLSSFSIQIATNLLNDAEDFIKGADTETRIGPQRVTQSGVFSYKQVLFLGLFFLALAIFFGVLLFLRGGLPILGIGLISVFLAYGYTGGPFPLAYLGLGDLFVILFFGILAVMGMFYLQTLSWTFESFWLGLQIGLHAAVLIAINNLRDMNEDAQVGKKTLAVRLGIKKYRYEIALLIWIPFLMGLFWMIQGKFLAGLLPCLASPIALILSKNIFQTPPSPVYNKYLGRGALLHLVFGLLITVGFLF